MCIIIFAGRPKPDFIRKEKQMMGKLISQNGMKFIRAPRQMILLFPALGIFCVGFLAIMSLLIVGFALMFAALSFVCGSVHFPWLYDSAHLCQAAENHL